MIISDVLIIGSGGAGLRAAIELHDRGVDVLVVGKCKKREAHTTMAQGGINASLGTMDSDDSWQQHAADTIADGGGINNPAAVELLCEHAPQAVQELADWGCDFHREEDGRITQRFFGAATYRRACFSGDITGQAILNTLVDQVEKRDITVHSETYITSLLDQGGTVNGAAGLHMPSGELRIYHAKVVVLATGGHSRMFQRSSSHFWENNGDGIALATAKSAHCQDMEMFQFHPTGMVWPEEASGLLVTEAVRGEGGILTNANGERFMERYDRDRMELSARDIVARANFLEIEAGRGTEKSGVYLDISHKDTEHIQKRLPTMYERFQQYAGIDISKEKMEVAPTAHYSMGGLQTDHSTGKTTVDGLYAIGEVTAGVHGGNRLGGNSLAEICVFGRLTGSYIADTIDDMTLQTSDEELENENIRELENLVKSKAGRDPLELKKEIQEHMWHAAGVVRSAQSLESGIRYMESLGTPQMNIGGALQNNEKLIAAFDVLNMIPTCKMILQSALERTESRAAHYREDFPDCDPAWKKNILCSLRGDAVKLWTKEVDAIPKEIAEHLEGRREEHRLE